MGSDRETIPDEQLLLRRPKGRAERVSFFHNNGFPVRKVLAQRVIEDERKGQIRVVMDERRKEAVIVRKLPIPPPCKKILLSTIECLIVEKPNVQIHRSVIIQNRWRTGRGQRIKRQKLLDDGIDRYSRGDRHGRGADITRDRGAWSGKPA